MPSPTAGLIVDCHHPYNGLLYLWRLLSAFLLLGCNSGPSAFHHCYWFLIHITHNDLFSFFSIFPFISFRVSPPTKHNSSSCVPVEPVIVSCLLFWKFLLIMLRIRFILCCSSTVLLTHLIWVHYADTFLQFFCIDRYYLFFFFFCTFMYFSLNNFAFALMYFSLDVFWAAFICQDTFQD